ncbi:hypothetical protein DNU06_06610 [Putridiphycobacter roseus]|uniref:Outer membrane protein beta-barrel domain-containing protein n=1 Tax=Putridiphycobacter roseus TaxID=2219161 RepID=A0A2W1NDJ2_9FLAO|nr:hypothetical protein [Putridiphycobacter roseus]PZE17495.1 hypothetical protein DNU06_06610 [Putridiphycobacter roseus]
MRIKLTVFYIGFLFIVNGQDYRKFTYGLNAGVKFANRTYAERYTGFYQDQLINFFNTPYNYQIVREMLGNKDFQFLEFSELYRFKPATVYGVNLGFQASPNLSFEGDFNFSNLKMIGGYTLELIDPGNFTSQEIYQNGYISGEESRFNARISLNYTTDGEKLKYVFGLSGMFNFWRMESNEVELLNSIITNLYSQFDPTNSFFTRTTGNGIAYGINAGIQYPISNGMQLQILYQPYLGRMDYYNTKDQIEAYGASYIKPKLLLEHDLIVRFVFR